MAQPSSAGELDAVRLETELLEQWKSEQAFVSSIQNRKKIVEMLLELINLFAEMRSRGKTLHVTLQVPKQCRP